MIAELGHFDISIQKFSTSFLKLSLFQLFLSLILKTYENILKIHYWLKGRSWFSNNSACKYPSKMVQYSKWTFEYQVSNEIHPNHGVFWFLEKSGKNHGAIFLKHFKRLHHGFCLIFPKIKSSHGWGQSHLKLDIQRSVFSTEPFLRDICRLRYLKINSELFVN